MRIRRTRKNERSMNFLKFSRGGAIRSTDPLHWIHLMKINAWKIAQESVSVREQRAGRSIR